MIFPQDLPYASGLLPAGTTTLQNEVISNEPTKKR